MAIIKQKGRLQYTTVIQIWLQINVLCIKLCCHEKDALFKCIKENDAPGITILHQSCIMVAFSVQYTKWYRRCKKKMCVMCFCEVQDLLCLFGKLSSSQKYKLEKTIHGKSFVYTPRRGESSINNVLFFNIGLQKSNISMDSMYTCIPTCTPHKYMTLVTPYYRYSNAP